MAFVLDNGAGGTSVTPAVAQDLSLPVARQVETAGGLGGMVNVRTHHVSEAAFGPLSLQDVELAALEGPVFESHTIAGLAGVDLFADRTVWWDLERYSVSLTPGGEAPVSDPCWQLVDSEWMRPWRVMVPVVIDGISGMAMLDTGAQKSVINNAFATAIGGERVT
ncbi:MAG: retropepsin-like domain-containing protein [Caulobacteraceae bacterium]|nr:retropepsin-like domain-containing protein [Caulobacteraceae bacterium]